MAARVLVVDDQRSSRELLMRAVAHLRYEAVGAGDGEAALAVLRAPPGGASVDVVLLDLVMPVMDGFATLQAIKADEGLRHLPVLMVSAVDATDSVIRCIELGATDYLPKPVHGPLLAARLRASLAEKRMRDLELDHLQQVDRVTAAAVAVEAGRYDAPGLESVAARDDALGALARAVQRMATEVRDREAALQAQVERLRIEIDRRQLEARVAEVTGTDYYRRLTGEAAGLKRLLHDGPAAGDGTGDDVEGGDRERPEEHLRDG